jgi:F420-non-reducing hydrogenase iron-sulfur subunit
VSDYEPKIIGFLCNFCAYAGADLAGVSHFQYPTNIRSIRVLCSTRITSHIILEVFREGADGVLIGGCHIDDCCNLSAHIYTSKRVEMARQLMEFAGLDSERLKLEPVSASEGEKFAELVAEFVTRLKELGPSPVKDDKSLLLKLDAAIETAKEYRLRLLSGKEFDLTWKGNVYGKIVDVKELDALAEVVVKEDYERNLILQMTKSQPLSVKELAKEIGAPTQEILQQIVVLRSRNLIAMDSIEGATPKYRALARGGA